MKIVYEELWVAPRHPGIIAITANSIVRSNGALVMGRGSALEATQHIPGIEFESGALVKQFIESKVRKFYGWLIVRQPAPPKLGFALFQAKVDWQDVASLGAIMTGTNELRKYAESNPNVTIRMPFPGIGNGQVGRGIPPTRQALEAILEDLPDNVTVVIRSRDRRTS